MVNWSGFDEGSHQVACWAGDTSAQGGPSGWHDIHEPHPTTWEASPKYDISGGSGSVQLPCFMGRSYNGVQVAVMIDGVRYEARSWNAG
jgi:hypothetical protein